LAALLVGEGVVVHNTAEDRLKVEGLASEQIGIAAAQAGITLYELAAEGASLEEAYMALTRDAVDYHGSAVLEHGDAKERVAA
jgi:ABC-2 type transport system ATP-binding protein